MLGGVKSTTAQKIKKSSSALLDLRKMRAGEEFQVHVISTAMYNCCLLSLSPSNKREHDSHTFLPIPIYWLKYSPLCKTMTGGSEYQIRMTTAPPPIR